MLEVPYSRVQEGRSDVRGMVQSRRAMYRPTRQQPGEVGERLGVALAGSGVSAGDSGFGFKKETYKTGKGTREGSIEEQSTLFGAV